MATRQIVITGYIGSGKTTLFNLICKTSQPVKSGGNSITRQTFLKEAAYGSGFRVLDTPGYASKQEKIIHAVGVLNALSEGPVSQILLVVKWERIDFMQEYLKSMVVKFRRFKHLLTAAVTHWDTADKETIKENEEQVIKLCKVFGINSVIFVSKFDSGGKVCAQIDSILDKCQAEKIELTEAEFYSNFDLIELGDEIELELEFQKENIEVKFKKIANGIIKFIKEFDGNNPSMHEIMHLLALETKKKAEELIEDFEIKNNDKFSKLFEYHSNVSLAYLIHFELKKALMMDIDKIVKLTQEKMKTDKHHPFNFIKACPHCGLVWLRVSGCDGITSCGDFPTTDDNKDIVSCTTPNNYKISITEQGVDVKLNENASKPQTPMNNKQYKIPSKVLGCGKSINWKVIPELSTYQLKELIDPGLMDYFATEIPKEELQITLMKAQKSLQVEVEIMKQQSKIIKLQH